MKEACHGRVHDRVEELARWTLPGNQSTAKVPARRDERRAPGADHEFLVRMRVWPGGEDRVLGHTGAHGVPTRWE